MATLHQQRTHPEPVEGCFGCRVAGVQVAPSATPSRRGGAEAAATNAREARWSRDMPAYREMRRQGLQPKGIDGAADLAQKATTEEHVTTGLTHIKPAAFTRFESEFGHKASTPAA